MKRARRLVALVLVAAALLFILLPIAPEAEYQRGREWDPCAWCAYVPVWCGICGLMIWWEEGGCIPGSPWCD